MRINEETSWFFRADEVAEKASERCWLAEVFGHLLTSDNYDDTEKKANLRVRITETMV